MKLRVTFFGEATRAVRIVDADHAAIVAKLNSEICRILQLPDVEAQFDKMGIQTIAGTSEAAAA